MNLSPLSLWDCSIFSFFPNTFLLLTCLWSILYSCPPYTIYESVSDSSFPRLSLFSFCSVRPLSMSVLIPQLSLCTHCFILVIHLSLFLCSSSFNVRPQYLCTHCFISIINLSSFPNSPLICPFPLSPLLRTHFTRYFVPFVHWFVPYTPRYFVLRVH